MGEQRTKQYFMESSDIGKLIRGEIIDLAQDKKGPRGLQIVICDNPTNGDMLKALFDVKVKRIYKDLKLITVVIAEETKVFNLVWWNAPYKPKGE